MNILFAARKTISLFLAFILPAGTITVFFPSSTEVYAISDYRIGDYKSKLSSIEKDDIVCNNFNLNLNGLDVHAMPEPLSILLTDQSETEEREIGTGIFGNDVKRFGYNEDYAFICKNNNNNELIVSPTPLCEVTVDTITELGDGPTGIAYDPNNQRMYVTNFNDDTVSVIDIETNTIDPTAIPVGDGPTGIAHYFGNQVMFVTNFNDDTVQVIFTDTNTPGFTRSVGDEPTGIANDSINDNMYVTNFGDDTVTEIEAETGEIAEIFTVGDGPTGIAFDPDKERMYVTNFNDGTVTVIDSDNETVDPTAIPVGDEPTGIAYDPNNQDMYVVHSNTVSVIDTTTNTVVGNPIPVGNGATGIANDPINDRMYVTNTDEDTVSVINLC